MVGRGLRLRQTRIRKASPSLDLVDNLVRRLARGLKRKRWSLAVAESCTGGLLGYWITRLPGASAFFAGGVIAYTDDVKRGMLGVSGDLLARHGAVSDETARAMAEGVRDAVGSQIALSVTGIAGPSGGTRKKPVGRVHIAVSRKGGETRTARFDFQGEREAIRMAAARKAIELLIEEIG